MIGRDCRCPGCGTCDAASEVERLRERLAVERTPNGAGKWNAERGLREKAERERDEARAKADTYERDWYEAKSEFGTATAKLREKVRTLEAALTTETRVSLDYQNQRDEVRKDFDSLEADAARVTLAYLHGDKIELDEAVYALMSNGRDKWWEAYKPVGLRGEDDD